MAVPINAKAVDSIMPNAALHKSIATLTPVKLKKYQQPSEALQISWPQTPPLGCQQFFDARNKTLAT
jgi:hypothetical protein